MCSERARVGRAGTRGQMSGRRAGAGQKRLSLDTLMHKTEVATMKLRRYK